jgi:SAM-dependent methyltransferase
MHFAGPHARFDSARPLALIHYHNSALNVVGMLEPPGAVEVHEQAATAEANRLIRSHFNSRVFWDFRYRHFPERGSGVGSRGENLAYKRDLLRAEGIEVATSVLDVGCGDLEVVGALDLRNYVGLDQSPQSLAMARAKRPDWTFLKAPAESVEPADFVVCFEVLIHQPSFADYRALVDFIARSTVRCLVISGYDHAVDHVAPNHMLYFHEPLRQSLEVTGRFAAIRQIGAHSDVVVYRCDVG